jgi:hypothetical protein
MNAAQLTIEVVKLQSQIEHLDDATEQRLQHIIESILELKAKQADLDQRN